MSTAGPIVRVEQLTARYGSRTIFENVSFDVERGEIVVILGGSGCGKSTLLKHVIGLYQPAAGRIWIGEEDISTADGDERRRILQRIGVAYQAGALFGSMTLRGNVRLPLEEYTELPDAAMDLIADSKLKMVGLAGFEEHLPSEISGGMMKRAALARAMALDPPLLCLDEPSAGLDPLTSAALDQTILELREALGVTFLVVTHELASIDTIADRVIMLDKEIKGIIDTGPPQELREHSQHEWVRRFFRREATDSAMEGPPA